MTDSLDMPPPPNPIPGQIQGKDLGADSRRQVCLSARTQREKSPTRFMQDGSKWAVPSPEQGQDAGEAHPPCFSSQSSRQLCHWPGSVEMSESKRHPAPQRFWEKPRMADHGHEMSSASCHGHRKALDLTRGMMYTSCISRYTAGLGLVP